MEYLCVVCNKKFASRQSRWNHTNNIHKKIDKNVVQDVVKTEKSLGNVAKNVALNNDQKEMYDNSICKFCNKKLCDRKYRWKHEQKCKLKQKENTEENTLLENKLLKNKINEMEKQFIEIQKLLKIHPKTLNKINNQLNNQNVNNGNVVTNIFKLGHENLSEVLSEKQKLAILNRQANSINQLVEMVHTGNKFSQFKNVYITNLQSSFGYKYDDKTNKFIAVNKNELLNDIIEARTYDIHNFYEELEGQMEENKAKQLKKFLDRINEDPQFKNVKKEEIKLILYNNKESLKKVYDKCNKEIEI